MKKPGVSVRACNLCAGEHRRVDPRDSLEANLAYLGEFQADERPCLKIILKESGIA